jgi:N6-L-threonylcarbamoyladenine synthase
VDPLPRPMMHSGDYHFSFSGLKTSVLYKLRNLPDKLPPTTIQEFAYEFQQAAVDVLGKKTQKAVEEFSVKTLLLGGGVSANEALRQRLQEVVKRDNDITLYFPAPAYTGDNATMIALAAFVHSRGGKKHILEAKSEKFKDLKARGKLALYK